MPRRAIRGLRFRLTVTYLLFFSALLVLVGLVFRETLWSVYDSQLHHILEEEWAAVRGYLRVEKPKRGEEQSEVVWYYDRGDPEEAIIVDRLLQVFLLADEHGNLRQIGPTYSELPVDSPDEIREVIRTRKQNWKTKRDSQGNRYLIRAGVLTGEDGRPYYISLGHSYAEAQETLDQFTWNYYWMLPLILVSAGVLGWFMAGRALRPVNDVAKVAQHITGENLTTRIPERGTGDELDRLIEAFNRMIERLNESFTQTRQFSTDVSHELRTPLTAIRGQLEVALLAARTPEQYQEAILNALEDVERLSKTIRALLLLSQSESGQLTLQLQPLNLAEIAGDLVDQFQIPAETAKVSLFADLSPEALIAGDRVQIERLLSNLLSNALKYNRQNGDVHVSISAEGDDVMLRVADTGIGISTEHLPHIFDRFYRVPEVYNTPGENTPERGLGLGLNFVAWIVKAHRGTITVESRPGEGTTFTIRFPKAPACAVETTAQFLPSNPK
jgi:heavy metal sensor kinase